jgi:hypothetical protein
VKESVDRVGQRITEHIPTSLRQSIEAIEYNEVAKAKGLENFAFGR